MGGASRQHGTSMVAPHAIRTPRNIKAGLLTECLHQPPGLAGVWGQRQVGDHSQA